MCAGLGLVFVESSSSKSIVEICARICVPGTSVQGMNLVFLERIVTENEKLKKENAMLFAMAVRQREGQNQSCYGLQDRGSSPPLNHLQHGGCDGQRACDLKWVAGKANVQGWNPNFADPYSNTARVTWEHAAQR